MLNTTEWEELVKIIFNINQEYDSFSLRKNFLYDLRKLIGFQIAEFSMLDINQRLYDSAEVNMFNGEKINIAEKYNDYKESYGSDVLDFIYQYPESNVAATTTTDMQRDLFESSLFKSVFLKKINMKHCCTLVICIDGRPISECALYYSSDPDFGKREVYILNQLKDHLTAKMKQMRTEKRDNSILTNNQIDILIGSNITERELQIIEMVTHGLAYNEITDRIHISIHTLKKHIYNIYKKLNINSKMQLKKFLDDIE